VSRKGEALDDLYICSMELALFLLDKPKRMTAAKTAEMEELLAECTATQVRAFEAGATKAEVREMVKGAEEDAGMIDEMAASGMKITVEI